MSLNQQSIDQTVALAGITQSTRIVQHIAWKGQTNETDFKAVLASLLRIDAPSAIAVYNGTFEVSSGLRVLKQQLDSSNADKDPEFVGLIINILSLHKQLITHPDIVSKLTQLMNQLSKKYSDENIYTDFEKYDQLLADCSDIYKQTLSKLPNRIQVKGDPNILKQDEKQIRVRAALLCAMRSVFLWRQCGGSRWHFLFKKKVILEAVVELIRSPRKD